jgi:hypothetical protein
MKILLGNNTFDILAGTEMWMLTLATELRKLGHEVTAYSPQLGFVATKMEAVGAKCINEVAGQGGAAGAFNFVLEEERSTNYDIIICNHNEITKYLKEKLPNVPIIATIHGIIHKNPETGEIYPEHPVTEFKVDKYLAVSEEVQDLLMDVYGIQAKVFRNFFDLDRFKYKKKNRLESSPKTIMVSSNYWGVEDPINQIIKEVADHYNARFIGIGANFASTYEVEQIMADADIVFGMGRSVMEGVCMGKIGVVHGRWGTGGVINPESYKTLKLTNFSGRIVDGQNQLKPAQEIIDQIDKAWNVKTIDEMRKIIEKDHNVKVAAKKLVAMAEELIKK